MKKAVLIFLTAAVLILQPCCRREKAAPPAEREIIKPGVEVFLSSHLDLVKGKKVGLITNPTGVDRELRSTTELFAQNPAINLVALYGPEHGIRGNAQAGEYVPFYFDDKFKIPVFSLYGQSFKPDPGMLKDIDRYMRSFDTTEAGKIPEGAMIQDVDVLVFDIQDVGTRVYTYIASMAYAMQACAESGVEFIVLDRPNPVNGIDMEGPILEYPEFSSFVGLYPVPLRHGMTVGELALLFNEKFFEKKAKLTIIPMEGWKRTMWFDETRLLWIIPSPNMPTPETAIVYPGQVLFEGTNVSEGRGTTKPFELFGAPWIDGFELALRLRGLGLKGVGFREAWFTPSFSKYTGEKCGGAQVHVTDRHAFRPLATSLHIIKTIKELYPDKFSFHPDYFDRIMGNSRVREAIERNASVEQILASFEDGLKAFAAERKPYLLY